MSILSRDDDHRLAMLVHQGNDPTLPYQVLVIRESATLNLRINLTGQPPGEKFSRFGVQGGHIICVLGARLRTQLPNDRMVLPIDGAEHVNSATPIAALKPPPGLENQDTCHILHIAKGATRRGGLVGLALGAPH